MEPKKILVKEGDIAIVTCPSCQKIRKLSVEKYKQKGKRDIKIRCNCENIFEVFLEFRKFPRKSTKLIGKTFNISKRKDPQKVIIKNVSMGGVGFTPFNGQKYEMFDQLMMSFNLDDVALTHIDTQVTVRAANENYVGCEFNSFDQFKKDLGFYLIA
jgi:hypothetical protein